MQNGDECRKRENKCHNNQGVSWASLNSVQQHCTSGYLLVTWSAALIAVLDLSALRVARRASRSPEF